MKPRGYHKGVPLIENLSLAELKCLAKASGYTKIRLRMDGAPSVALATWNGVATEAGPFVHADVWYNLDGATLVVTKTGELDTHFDLA